MDVLVLGEQVKLLICLPANKHITRIDARKSGTGERHQTHGGKFVGGSNPVLQAKEAETAEENNRNGDAEGKIDLQKDVAGESFLEMEDHRRQTDRMLGVFKNSHFFARIAESDEPLWSERSSQAACVRSSKTFTENLAEDSLETAKTQKKKNPISVVIDRGKFDSPTSGGVARGAAKCCSLSNGDIVVHLPKPENNLQLFFSNTPSYS